MTRPVCREDIIDFWFSEPVAKLWFNSTVQFDQQLRTDYESLYHDAKAGKYDHWMDTAQGCLALVIIFDQFPLNMYRGKPESFASEENAISVARHALEHSFDEQLDERQKAFLYMPFMHSENPEDQERSVLLYEKANLTNNIRFARHHRDLIRRFGRFPHRNRILGRQSTDEELEYLQSKEAFLG
jgi:uncharacterized protein (DUF924 family)